MATFNDLEKYARQLPAKLKQTAAAIIAETATEDFKQNFTRKSFDGRPWPDAQNPPPRGSLMVRSGSLVNSIKPTTVTPQKVVITAGDSHAPYARIHNQGFVGGVTVKPHHRSTKATQWAKNPLTQKHHRTATTQVQGYTKRMVMPRRQFMGYSKTLETAILKRLKAAFKNQLNSLK